MSFEIKAPQLVEAIEHFIDSVDNRLDGYDQKLEVFEADIPTQLFARMSQTLYVDPTVGVVGNDGKDWSRAVPTVAEAVKLIPSGGVAQLYLRAGVTHQLTEKIDLKNKTVWIEGQGYQFYQADTYVPIESIANINEGVVAAGAFVLGWKGALRITGCQLRTVKYTAAQVSAGIEVWHSSLISTFGSIGKVFLEHCLVTLNNGALMHQHTGGSIGLADLYMRNVTIGLTDRATLATTAGWPYLIAKYLDGKMPFFVYGIEMTRLNGLTWAYLLNVDLTHAITNLKD